MRRRILLLITDLEIGGTPTVVRELAVRLHQPPSVVVDVACLARWGPVADELVQCGIGVTAFDAAHTHDILTAVPRLVRTIRGSHKREAKAGYDTVFSFLVHANVVAAAASAFCPGTRFIQSLQTTQPEPRWHWWVQSLAQHVADRVVVPSASVARIAHDWAGAPRERIVIIPNAIDPTDFPPVRGSVYSGGPSFLSEGCDGFLSSGVRPQRIGFIGRLDPIKRIPDLIAAVSLLGPQIRLDIFGEGPQRRYIEALIAHNRLSSRISLHGTVPRPQEALRQMDLLVLPSAAEGFGLVLIEAMASCVPVVATDVAGIRDVVQNGRTGILVPPASPRELARAIAVILCDHALRDRLVTVAREDVLTRFNWASILPQYRALLRLLS